MSKDALPATKPLLYRTAYQPRKAVSSERVWVTFDDGEKVIDAFGGAAVACIGAGNKTVIEACTAQMSALPYIYGQQFTNQPAEDLAKYLIDASAGAFVSVNFLAGGSEAVESAIKLARQYWWELKQPQRVNIIGRQMSYHGNTLGALSVAFHPVKREPFAALLNENVFHHVSPAMYRHYKLDGETELAYSQRLADELEAKFVASGPETVAAFIAEPMVGSSTGCTTATENYWRLCKAVCNKHGVLMIFDEVMCGMWRCGSLFAYETLCEGVAPDILAAAKGLGAGYVSVGAIFANSRVVHAIQSGSRLWNHGFTYSSHPVTCAGALAVQQVIVKEKLFERIVPMGERLSKRLTAALQGPASPVGSFVSEIRGRGLFYALEYEVPNQTKVVPRVAARLQAAALELGAITLGMAGTIRNNEGDVLMLAPAMICTDEEIDHIADVVVAATVKVYGELVAAGLV